MFQLPEWADKQKRNRITISDGSFITTQWARAVVPRLSSRQHRFAFCSGEQLTRVATSMTSTLSLDADGCLRDKPETTCKLILLPC
jgi:hypothetical protein